MYLHIQALHTKCTYMYTCIAVYLLLKKKLTLVVKGHSQVLFAVLFYHVLDTRVMTTNSSYQDLSENTPPILLPYPYLTPPIPLPHPSHTPTLLHPYPYPTPPIPLPHSTHIPTPPLPYSYPTSYIQSLHCHSLFGLQFTGIIHCIFATIVLKINVDHSKSQQLLDHSSITGTDS